MLRCVYSTNKYVLLRTGEEINIDSMPLSNPTVLKYLYSYLTLHFFISFSVILQRTSTNTVVHT